MPYTSAEESSYFSEVGSSFQYLFSLKRKSTNVCSRTENYVFSSFQTPSENVALFFLMFYKCFLFLANQNLCLNKSFGPLSLA